MSLEIYKNLQDGFLSLVLMGEQRAHKNLGDDLRMFTVCALERAAEIEHVDAFSMFATRYFWTNFIRNDEWKMLGDECLVFAGLLASPDSISEIRTARDVGQMAYAAHSGNGGGQAYSIASEAFPTLVTVLRSVEKPKLRVV